MKTKSLRSGVFALLPFFVALSALAGAGARPFKLPFGKLTRLSPGPIISPQGEGFESAGTFNPAVVKKDGKVVMLYRAQDRKGTSSLGYATSDDGIHFLRRSEPVLVSDYFHRRRCAHVHANLLR